jgi:hypothetical protein
MFDCCFNEWLAPPPRPSAGLGLGPPPSGPPPHTPPRCGAKKETRGFFSERAVAVAAMAAAQKVRTPARLDGAACTQTRGRSIAKHSSRGAMGCCTHSINGAAAALPRDELGRASPAECQHHRLCRLHCPKALVKTIDMNEEMEQDVISFALGAAPGQCKVPTLQRLLAGTLRAPLSHPSILCEALTDKARVIVACVVRP